MKTQLLADLPEVRKTDNFVRINLEACGLLAHVEVAEAVEVLGAVCFLGGITYRIQFIIKYGKADNNTRRGITKITVIMHVTVAAWHCCLETYQKDLPMGVFTKEKSCHAPSQRGKTNLIES